MERAAIETTNETRFRTCCRFNGAGESCPPELMVDRCPVDSRQAPNAGMGGEMRSSRYEEAAPTPEAPPFP